MQSCNRIYYSHSDLTTAGHHMQIQLELLMMRGVPLETYWAFNERWNNKFCYKVATCWLFLLKYTCMLTYSVPKNKNLQSTCYLVAAFKLWDTVVQQRIHSYRKYMKEKGWNNFKQFAWLECAVLPRWGLSLIFMDPCIVVWLSRNNQQDATLQQNLLFHRSLKAQHVSSGIPLIIRSSNCTCSLWFTYECGDRP
jgi:hypothetical protein